MEGNIAAPGPATPVIHPFEFRGSAGEYFKIWFVNICLTLVTLGIFSAWAKVRTTRYFRGNTYVAGHSFDYHASPLRILLGRAIAVAMIIIYEISRGISPFLAIPVFVLFLCAIPWLIVSSLRFNARNTSYRNVRFNFTGRTWGAVKAYLLWPLAAVFTLYTLVPLAHKKRDYYTINHHTYGGKPLTVSFKTWSIYAIYLIGLASIILIMAVGAAIAYSVIDVHALATEFQNLVKETAENAKSATDAANNGNTGTPDTGSGTPNAQMPVNLIRAFFIFYPLFILGALAIAAVIQTLVFNLALSNTQLDGGHGLHANLSPFTMIWINLSNLILVLVSLGFLYPWARVRLARYQANHLALSTTTDLDEFASEAMATQGAIGEEIAAFFDINIGL